LVGGWVVSVSDGSVIVASNPLAVKVLVVVLVDQVSVRLFGLSANY
jgi:hypothetical protein